MMLLPYVLYDGTLYEMWYAGSRGTYTSSRTGYATSPDGIHWTKEPHNPVLGPGPPDSWDEMGTNVGGVLLEGNLYRMWYIGSDGVIDRTGYAVSPRGAQVQVSADGRFVAPGKDSVFISVRVQDPSGLSFAAEIDSTDDHRPADLIELLDDGVHGDSLPGDGLFANRWPPREERNYSVKLQLSLRGERDAKFQFDNAASFTSIGPLKLEKVVFVGDADAHPGDTAIARLALRNHGSSVPADSVTAKISTTNKWVTDITSVFPDYGTIGAVGSALTAGYYRFFVSPNCPLDTDIPFDIQISSAGIPRWRDRFVISVLPPWWRSNWAYAFYLAVALGVLYGLWRLEARRLHLKHRREMEHFQLEKMKEVDQLKSRFFANISHEFRTPLTLIEGPLKQLMSGEMNGKVDEQYDVMLRNTHRLTRLVNQLLDLSKIDSGQMKLHVRQLEVVEPVREIAAAFESLAKRKGIEFCVEYPEQPIVGWFDPDAVEKVVTNLLSNAFKFTNVGGAVKVGITCRPEPVSGPILGMGADSSSARQGFAADRSKVIITVSDTGVGIPAGQLDKVFDRFYQVDQSQTREYEGTGIGLALTKELVELHKGEICVTSEVGKGTTFTVRLPLGKEHFSEEEITQFQHPSPQHVTALVPELHASAAAAEESDTDGSHPLVLIVEDNADMRKYMRSCLDNYRIIEAINGEEGLEKAVDTIPDLIISDVMMPEMDGFTLCAKLKNEERTSHIPVILLTARAEATDRISGLETGADDYVTKPFDARELLVRVKNLIEGRKKLREHFQKAGIVALDEVAVTSLDKQFVARAMSVIEKHLPDSSFTADQFATEMFVSRTQLNRKIRALTGLSSWHFVRKVRLHRAAELLRKRAGNIAEVAYQVGYESPPRFTEAFHEEFGQTPSDFHTSHPV
jgi:signal transduction histidine kinase/DNA-binding response OmpR family regulator